MALLLLLAAATASAQEATTPAPAAPQAPASGQPQTGAPAPSQPGTFVPQLPPIPVQRPVITNQPAPGAPAGVTQQAPRVPPGAAAPQAVPGGTQPGQAVPGQAVAPPGQLGPTAAQPQQPAETAGAQQLIQTQPATERTDFQDFVAQSVGRVLPMFGYSLFTGVPSTFAPVDRVPVTPDYVVGPGDELIIRAWGQIDVDFRAVVDRNGAINIPKVGVINVAGIKFQDLNGYLKSQIGRIFRNFELNVTMGELRSIQIFVVGQAQRPGSYTVSSLSTLVNALFASGGPSVRGSMRRIQLKRDGGAVTEFDFYALLAKGDKSKDARLLPGDVIYIPPIGNLVAISGSVNSPAIFELKEQTTLRELVDLAGGFTTTAAGQKVMVERIIDRKIRKVDEFVLDAAGFSKPLQDGDLISVFAISPRFENAVRLQGHVAAPARYPWREGMRVADLLVGENVLIPNAYWERQNRGAINTRYSRREVNWDYAVIQRLELPDVTTRLYAFNLGKAIRGDRVENVLLKAGDIVTIYAADEALPRTENDVALDGSVISGGTRRFVWHSGMRIRDLIPDARWLIEYYDYWLNLKGGGLRSDINWDYASITRLQPQDLSKTVLNFDLGKAVLENDPQHNVLLRPGDEIRIFTKEELQVPVSKQAMYVRLEGEVNYAGVYRVLPGETLRQLVTRVGGLTGNAYLYAGEFTRDSVRALQQRRLDEAIDSLEREIQRNLAGVVAGALSRDDVEAARAQAEGQKQLVARLRQMKATGRIVLDFPSQEPQLRDLPDVVLEDGDRFLVPSRPSTVNVVGSVYNQNAFIYRTDYRVTDYLTRAGGPTRDADTASIYLVRADGTVVSQRQTYSFFGTLAGERLMPGDTVVVPEQFEKFRFTKELKDWTLIFYQFALGVAGIKVLKDL